MGGDGRDSRIKFCSDSVPREARPGVLWLEDPVCSSPPLLPVPTAAPPVGPAKPQVPLHQEEQPRGRQDRWVWPGSHDNHVTRGYYFSALQRLRGAGTDTGEEIEEMQVYHTFLVT